MKKLYTIVTIIISLGVFAANYKHPVPEKNNILLELSKGTKKALDPKSIKILDWNLHKGKDADFEKDFATLSKGKDILMVQEMLLDQKMTDVFLGYKTFGFETATSFFCPPSFDRTGVATASEVQSVETKVVRTEVLEPVINSPKVTIVTRYPIAGTNKILTIANIHSVNFVTPNDFNTELKRVFDTLKNYPKPIIFAGDFNTWNSEKIFFLDQLRISLNLKEASFTPDFRMEFNNQPLDHFLYSDDLALISAKVEGFYQGSDHKPLELEFEYAPNP